MERAVVSLFAEIAIGATGAPTLLAGNGIESVTRSAAGEYLVTLQDKYYRLLGLNVVLEAVAAENVRFQIKEEAVKESKTLSFFSLLGGVPTDPSDGSKIRLEIKLKNSGMVA